MLITFFRPEDLQFPHPGQSTSSRTVTNLIIMEEKSLAICFIVVLVNFSAFVKGKCPCEDKALCEPIARPQGKEFLMFSTKPNDWKMYDWTKVTTIALFRPWDDELMCEAHKRVSALVNSYLVAFFAPVRKLLPLKSGKEIASGRPCPLER